MEDIRLHHVRHGTLPLSAYGSGTRTTVLLAAFLVGRDSGVVLIDDIDGAMQYPASGNVFRCFLDACLEKGIQAFATTRSLEALDAILETAHRDYGQQDILRIVTLRKDDGADVTRARVLSGERAYENRRSFDMELRA